MYFDWHYYGKVLAHVWSLKSWSGRWPMLARLLLWIPVRTAFHTLCFLLDYALFPSLWRQQVREPVFIVGHARSGTTLMHRLMSADGDRFAYFLYWETFFPSLLQKKCIRGLGWLDQACLGGRIKKRLQAWDDKTFGPYRHMHNMSLWNAEEDCFAMAAAFVSQQWALDIPMMHLVDFFHLDQMPDKRRRWMHHYKELVKRQLLLYGGERVHLSKNPMMSGWVDALIETFPDARIVVMMRNPEECIPSCLKLVEHAWRAKGWQHSEYQPSLDALTACCFEHFTNPAHALTANPATPSIVVDYRDLTGAPHQTVHEVYQALNIELRDDFDQWLISQSEREKKHHSKFEYSLGEFHLQPAQIREKLAGFYQQYQWLPQTIAPAQSSQESTHV